MLVIIGQSRGWRDGWSTVHSIFGLTALLTLFQTSRVIQSLHDITDFFLLLLKMIFMNLCVWARCHFARWPCWIFWMTCHTTVQILELPASASKPWHSSSPFYLNTLCQRPAAAGPFKAFQLSGPVIVEQSTHLFSFPICITKYINFYVLWWNFL